MASTHKCEYCGSTITSEDRFCPNCGAENPNYIADTPRQVFLPRTVAELKEYCAERGMPLLRMRFFIGEDYREPKAFGIYRDGDEFVVYKNKADGSRAVRYRGPDEAHAVDEIFTKLLEECHNRGIYPDGKPAEGARSGKKKTSLLRIFLTLLAVMLAVSLISAAISGFFHRNDGYYNFGGGTVYYHHGPAWYYTYDDNISGYWYEADNAPASDPSEYYIGEDWDSDWGVSDFKESSTWESIQESSSSSSSDYDSWDSGGTDWDSDW